MIFEETIKWVDVNLEMPDSDICVMITNTLRDPWIGFYDTESEFWRNADGSKCVSPITYWAEMPEGPGE